MDAYSSYIKIISDARTADLRREAAEYALSSAARRRRRQRWIQAFRRLAPRRRATLPLPPPLPPQAWANNSAPSSR